jgi:succinyl-diaminopimelate desuccinylase
MDVISLTKKLLSFNNINPPGDEKEIAMYVGELLQNYGFNTEYFAFGESRLHLIAEKGISVTKPPIVFSGHFDTIPLGAKKWSVDPFAGEIKDNKIWGRGSSDMKGGVAAMICASLEALYDSKAACGIRLVLTAGEELGCLGAQHLVNEIKDTCNASAIIIGEPTGNLPAIGHKGAIYLNAVTTGITAHSSMPELGVNAIYKAAKAILKIKDFNFGIERDPLLGFPTINVGKMNGGMNLNSVPDHAEFKIDIRSTTKLDHNKIIDRLSNELGTDAVLETLVNLKPVSTDETDPFVQMVYNICGIDRSDKRYPYSLPFLTDGSVLQPFYKGVPTIILGPGQPEMAHQTDEFCYIEKLTKAVTLYKNIILKMEEFKYD